MMWIEKNTKYKHVFINSQMKAAQIRMVKADGVGWGWGGGW